MRVAIIGGGYVGLVTGACLADLGHSIEIIEIDQKKVDAINSGTPYLFEEGLEALLREHAGKDLKASSSYDAVARADITMICVGTPPNISGQADLTYIREASRSIGKALRDTTGIFCVIVKSTVPPGTTEGLVRDTVIAEAQRAEILFGMNPEFLREGRAIHDFFHPDRIVIGGSEPELFERITHLYRKIDAPVIRTRPAEAELIKYVSNAFLATKISFSNEIGNICKKMGVDVYKVMEGVGLDRRVGREFLNAGVGFGGSCFPKDVMALVRYAESLGEEPQMLKSVIRVNDVQPLKIISILEKRIGNIRDKKIAVLGLAFKDNTDDIRESRSIPVIQALLEKGAHVSAYDPLAIRHMQQLFPQVEYGTSAEYILKGADACLVMTEWPEFSRLDHEFDLMNQRVIIEGRRILTTNATEGICW
ncbi:MAG: UDP-glucose dehydrogenase family protein [Methanolinea sp.]